LYRGFQKENCLFDRECNLYLKQNIYNKKYNEKNNFD